MAGNPEAVMAGAAELATVAEAFTSGAEGVRAAGNELAAGWSGAAAAAAGEMVTQIGTSSAVPGEVATAARPKPSRCWRCASRRWPGAGEACRLGHTGNTLGYTQFIAASRDGRRSVKVSINLQRTQNSTGQEAQVFTALRAVEEDGVCAALAR